MYYRITRYRFDPSRLDAGLAWIDTMRPTLEKMGALTMDRVLLAPGEAAVVSVYPSKAVADASAAQATENFREAAQRGLLDAQSVQRSEGEVVKSVGRR